MKSIFQDIVRDRAEQIRKKAESLAIWKVNFRHVIDGKFREDQKMFRSRLEDRGSYVMIVKASELALPVMVRDAENGNIILKREQVDDIHISIEQHRGVEDVLRNLEAELGDYARVNHNIRDNIITIIISIDQLRLEHNIINEHK